MELRPRSGISVFQAKPRATSLGRKAERDKNKVDDVENETLVNSPSSATRVTRDGKSSSRIHPVEGGRTRTSIPLPRSESAGGAVRSPEGDPPHRPGPTWEYGDVGGRATPDRQPLAAAAIVGNATVHPDEGAEFTIVYMIWTYMEYSGENRMQYSSRAYISPGDRDSTSNTKEV